LGLKGFVVVVVVVVMIMAYREVVIVTSFLRKARKLKALYKLISLLSVAMFLKLKVMKSTCHSMQKLVHLTVTKLMLSDIYTLLFQILAKQQKQNVYSGSCRYASMWNPDTVSNVS